MNKDILLSNDGSVKEDVVQDDEGLMFIVAKYISLFVDNLISCYTRTLLN